MPSLRTMLTSLALSAAIVTASACDSSGIVSPVDLTRFALAKARWEARPFTDYRYEIRTFCFCPPEIGQWTRVTVRNGAVISAEAVEPDPQYPITTITFWNPIDTLFARLDRAMSESRFDSPYAAIDVEYDAELGYPSITRYREKPTVADANATIEVRTVLRLN